MDRWEWQHTNQPWRKFTIIVARVHHNCKKKTQEIERYCSLQCGKTDIIQKWYMGAQSTHISQPVGWAVPGWIFKRSVIFDILIY